MKSRNFLLVVLLLFLIAAPAARADTSAFWRSNPITPAAIANDPTLASKQSWSVMVTITSGFWISAGLRATLPAGNTFYRHPLGGFSRPGVTAISANPALEFHTYVTHPRQTPSGSGGPAIFGGFPDIKSEVSFGGAFDEIPGTFSVAWGDPIGVHPTLGTYEIARLTFPSGVLPVVIPESFTASVNPHQVVRIPTTIPEPAALGMIAVIALLARRSA